MRERLNAATARLDRVDIVAPASGVVNELNVSTVGGVISPAERLLTIVLDDADLTIEFRVAVTERRTVVLNLPLDVQEEQVELDEEQPHSLVSSPRSRT